MCISVYRDIPLVDEGDSVGGWDPGRLSFSHDTAYVIRNGYGQSTTVRIPIFSAHMVCQGYITVCSVTYYHPERIRDVPIPVKQVGIARRVMRQQCCTFMT